MKKPLPELRALTPSTLQGWKAKDRGTLYDPERVFEALNGGAEVYLDYRFQRVLIREYTRERRPGLTVHLFDMGRAPDAYGIFSHERESPRVPVGTDGEYADGLLRFWKGRYFVSVHATRETKAVRDAILALGRHIAQRIPDRGAAPKLVQWLPGERRRPGTVRYLHTAPTLRHHLRQIRGNPLGLSKRTAVAIADYAGRAGTIHGLIIRYPASTGARRAGRALPSVPDVGHAVCGRYVVAAVGGDSQDRSALVSKLKRQVSTCASR